MKNPLEVVPGFIGGQEVQGGPLYTIEDPFDGTPVVQVSLADQRVVADAVANARSAAASVRELATYKRIDILHRVAAQIRRDAERASNLIVRCVGKTIREARAEVERSPEIFALSAEAIRTLRTECQLADAIPTGERKFALILREPVGVVAAITPFNIPLNGLCHKIAPAFAAGNAVVVKSDLRGAPIAAMMAQWFREAGAPAGCVNVVHGHADIGAAVVAHPDVDFIAFTGSSRAAREIQQICGLRRAQYELGGNAATVIDANSDWRKAVPALTKAAFGLSGQSCISLQRLLVQESIYADFVTAFLDASTKLKVGDPKLTTTDVGPVVSRVHADRICTWAEEAIGQGAELLLGGTSEGAVVQPTVLANSSQASRVMCEEVFGPLVNVVPYKDFDDALAMVNAGKYGLQASVYTNSLPLAMRAIRGLRTGGVVINGPSRQRLDHLPYGGRGDSGLGREGPESAIAEMTEVKTVVMNL